MQGIHGTCHQFLYSVRNSHAWHKWRYLPGIPGNLRRKFHRLAFFEAWRLRFHLGQATVMALPQLQCVSHVQRVALSFAATQVVAVASRGDFPQLENHRPQKYGSKFRSWDQHGPTSSGFYFGDHVFSCLGARIWHMFSLIWIACVHL